MKIIAKTFSLLFLSALLSSLLCGSLTAQAAEVQAPAGFKLVQTSKLQELKKNNESLVMKLAELELHLTELSMPSSELTKQLEQLRSELEKSRQDLVTAQGSLANAESLQKQTLASLQSLEQKLAEERQAQAKREKRIRRQRSFWTVAAGGLAVAWARK